MHYHFSVEDSHTSFFTICLSIQNLTEDSFCVRLPAWRPGRYEIQNFAKNIPTLSASLPDGSAIIAQKVSKDRWRIHNEGHTEVRIHYRYYANTQNAGSSYVDEELWYLNFINLCVYAEDRLHESCTVELALPTGYAIACGLPQSTTQHGLLTAQDFYQLVDSPLLASETLQHEEYEAYGVRFHVWMHGKHSPNWRRIKYDFRRFSREQIATMGEFPEADYHFLNLLLPTAFYHGVEHRNSTMIVLGPDDEGEGLYTDLLGISSHELFHAWNAIRIRPKELLPYDLTQETYFPTCFVVEGCTTYYGDLFLRRAGVLDDRAYFKELQVYMKRHFEGCAGAVQSLVESSYDLWLDGYEKGIPGKKVSVYHKGALVALILDLYLRKKSEHVRSLDDVMRLMWQRYGKPFVGYTYEDYKAVVEEVAEEPLDWYWVECVEGSTPLEARLNEALSFVGLQMTTFSNGSIQLSVLDDSRAARQRSYWLAQQQLDDEEDDEFYNDDWEEN